MLQLLCTDCFVVYDFSSDLRRKNGITGSNGEKNMDNKYTIAVASISYVSFSIAMLLSQCHKAFTADIIPKKVKINNLKFQYRMIITKITSQKELDLTATLDVEMAYSAADFVE